MREARQQLKKQDASKLDEMQESLKLLKNSKIMMNGLKTNQTVFDAHQPGITAINKSKEDITPKKSIQQYLSET